MSRHFVSCSHPAGHSFIARTFRNGLLVSLLQLTVCLCLCPVVCGEESLEKAIHHVVHQPHFKHAHWGALFVDRKTGDVIYEHAPQKLFAPASTTKLYSVACALDTLGADFRFRTPVVRHGEVHENVLTGDLILIASGDLSFGGRTTADGKIAFVDSDHTYSNGNADGGLTAPDPLGGLNDLAKQVVAAGIRRVHGDVLIDDQIGRAHV